jgi:Uma2 family endonuclease
VNALIGLAKSYNDRMATMAGLITVAEFEKLPEQHNIRQELRHGEVVTMPPPGMLHFWTARRIRRVLERVLGESWVVDRELPFRPLPEYEVWIADVAVIGPDKTRAAQSSWLTGVPEIVVEVLSPSNTAVEMDERRALCLENGCRQFWVVNTERKIVSVSTPDGKTITYRIGDGIDLAEFGGGKLSLADVFAE